MRPSGGAAKADYSLERYGPYVRVSVLVCSGSLCRCVGGRRGCVCPFVFNVIGMSVLSFVCLV